MTSRVEALRAAHAALLAGRFAQAAQAAEPWRAEHAGALLHALARAAGGEVEDAAPLLARLAAANPVHAHPVTDLRPLVPPAAYRAHLAAALRERPGDARLMAALGTASAEAGLLPDAIALLRRAVACAPEDAASWSNLGKALTAEGRFPDALGAHATAVRLAPGDARIGYNRACTLLKSGDLAAGFPALTARHGLPGRPPPLPTPRLRDLAVAGRTILLLHEEGFGDTIQFIRYAAELAGRGATVRAAMPAALTRLIATAPGIDSVTPLPALPPHDAWLPLLDLPALFGAVCPAPAPYLRPCTDAPPTLPAGRRVGLCWAGDPAGLLDRDRSIAPAALAPLRDIAGITWVSLQKGAPALPWMLDAMSAVRDFADTAAIVAALDGVVSVDTAVAHLAGALGAPVLLLDRYDNCWRWLARRADSPWYPGLTILRQATYGDWDGVIARAATMLDAGGFPPARPGWRHGQGARACMG